MSTLLDDARRGLLAPRKSLPPVWFYDETGSKLFEAITATPEYYPTNTEHALLREHADHIVAAVGTPVRVAELGAGSATKTLTLLDAVARQQDDVRFSPIDVSEEALRLAQDGVAARLPDVRVEPILGRNRDAIQQLDWTTDARWLILFLGSSIGNQEPANAARWLAEVTEKMRPHDAFLLGVDREKDPHVLTAAYNDAQGVTADFNLNLLDRMNRELGAQFRRDDFEHHAFYNAEEHRVEMHLRARRAHTVHVPRIGEVTFRENETIHTENSYKYNDAMLARLLHDAGLTERGRYEDARGWFSLILLARDA